MILDCTSEEGKSGRVLICLLFALGLLATGLGVKVVLWPSRNWHPSRRPEISILIPEDAVEHPSSLREVKIFETNPHIQAEISASHSLESIRHYWSNWNSYVSCFFPRSENISVDRPGIFNLSEVGRLFCQDITFLHKFIIPYESLNPTHGLPKVLQIKSYAVSQNQPGLRIRHHIRWTSGGQYPGTFGINHVLGLLLYDSQSVISGSYAVTSDNDENNSTESYYCGATYRPEINHGMVIIFSLFFGGFFWSLWVSKYINEERRFLRMAYVGFSLCSLTMLYFVLWLFHPFTWGVPPGWLPKKWNPCEENNEHCDRLWHRNSVSQKLLTSDQFLYYDNYMANVLPFTQQAMIIGSLCEGSSIRAIERLTGVHRDTIMRLGVRVGQGCAALLDRKMRDLSCGHLQLDEIWGFIEKKQRHVRTNDDYRSGDVWTFCAIDSDTKVVPAYAVGKRTSAVADAFVADLASRMRNRVQLSTDSLAAYVGAVEDAFGANVDYAQIIKTYVTDYSIQPERRFSAPEVTMIEKRAIVGEPDMVIANTSYVERLNATTRLHMRRLTRLTLAFSKKFENFEAAVGLHLAYYNFVLRHNTVKTTPAVAAGVEASPWNVQRLLEEAAA